MLDVLLINPLISYTDKSGDSPDDNYHHYPPLGYLYLAAALREKGFNVDVIHTSTILSLKQTLALIKRKKPRIIGLSAMLANMRGAYQLASEIKKKIKPSPVIILGGHHVSSDPDVINRYSCFDIGVTGEGEITLPEIVSKIIRNKEKIAGVIAGKLPPNLDKLPFPARDLIDIKLLKAKPIASLITSRGCPYNCVFCSRPAISRTIRYRSPKLIVAEMKEIYETTGIKEFCFHDDTFNLSEEHVFGVCQEIIDSGIKFSWVCQGRFNLVTEKTIKMMAQAGCYKIMFGVESGNERIRNMVIGKGITNAQIKKGINLCWKYNIEPDCFLMLGFPTETKKELYDTVNFGKNFLPNMLGANITQPYPGSKLWNDLVKKKQIDPKRIDDYILGKLGEGFRTSWPGYTPDGLTRADLIEARTLAHKRFYLSPKYILKRLSRDITSWQRMHENILQAFSIFRYGQSYRKRN
jgi:radical SAM superfamily enzyme YgiQ (UPF0313 family)